MPSSFVPGLSHRLYRTASLSILAGLVVLALAASPRSARACGDSEAGLVCDDQGTATEDGARWMLKRVVTAIGIDKAKALAAFTAGSDGFRTADTYVFCVGPDGIMSAHPNPILQGHDARDLHDRTGSYFIQTMLHEAKPGDVSVIRYLFPKPGSTVAEPKTTYYSHHAGELQYEISGADTRVRADVNGDGLSEFTITLSGHHTLQAGDFIL